MQKTNVVKVLNVNGITEGYAKLQILGMDTEGFMTVINESGECWKYHPNASLSYKVSETLNKEEKVNEHSQVSNTTKKLHGWRLMREFVDTEGNVYHRGIEQPHLKGSLPPTEKK